MKTKLSFFYHKYFSEIMTGILASLFIITVLIIYGIYNGTTQRNKMQEGQDILLQNDSISMKMSEEFSKKQDSAIASAEELRDLIQKK
jgi:hypothetical protein